MLAGGLFYATGLIAVWVGEESLGRWTLLNVFYLLIMIPGSHLLRAWCRHGRWLSLPAKGFWQRGLAACLVVGFGVALVYWPLDKVVDAWQAAPSGRSEMVSVLDETWAPSVVFSALVNSLFLIGWLLAYWSVHVWHHNQEIKLRHQALALEHKTAALARLQQQLNPHFLFNSLNSIRAMIHLNADDASDMVTELADLLRYSLKQPDGTVSLADELKILDCYLNLERVRFGDRLSVTQDIDDSCLQWPLPPMMLQTLVENAIKYGVSQRRAGGVVELHCRRRQQALCIDIVNDGDLTAQSEGLGMGLANCRERLALIYGDQAGLTLSASDNRVLTRVVIPAMKEEMQNVTD